MESLLDDLGSLGLKFEFRRGVDWGYGRNMDRALDGKSKMFFTSEAVGRLRAIGVLVGKPVPSIFEYTSVWKGTYCMSFFLECYSVHKDKALYHLIGSCGDSGFGTNYLQYHFRPRTVKMFQKEIEDLVTSLRG